MSNPIGKPKKEFLGKIVIIGEQSTGKSSLLRRYCENKFSDKYSCTVGVDFQIKLLKFGDKILKMQIWDTAGQERFKVMTRSYYQGAKACIILYDISRKNTFEKVITWAKEFRDMNPDDDSLISIVGNKKDLVNEREVPYDEGKDLANKYNALFAEVSVKESEASVTELFNMIAGKVLDILEIQYQKNPDGIKQELKIKIDEKKYNVVQSNGCCNN